MAAKAKKSKTKAELEQEVRELKAELNRKTMQGVNRAAKDSVFTDLFSKPEYTIQLYRALFPNDISISQKDISIITLQNTLGYQIHNDLGLLVRNTLIVLLEAQTKWTLNIIFRLVGYYYHTIISYLNRKSYNLNDTVKVPIPKMKAFVVYTGQDTINTSDLSLRRDFFGNDPDQPDFPATVIRLDESEGILKEFISFCKVFDEQMQLHEDEHLKAIQETIRICKKNGYLVDYLRDHEEEVERLMMAELVTRYTPVALDERSLKLKSAALVLLFAGHSDQEIKDLIIKAFNLESEEYAQNVLDYVKDHPDQNTWY